MSREFMNGVLLALVFLVLPAELLAAQGGPDFTEPPRARPPGETILPAFPIDKWIIPTIALDVALGDMTANPTLVVTMVLEISKDGINFAPVASITSRGGVHDRGKGKLPAPPGFRLSRNDAIPDGWIGRIRVTTNRPLTYGAVAGPKK